MSRTNVQKVEKNPPGFAERLDALMKGWGYSSRDIAARTSVSHMTIENWLIGKHQAGPEQVQEVAKLFGWTYGQLYSGEVPAGIMDKVAELEGFRVRARRLAAEIAGELGDAHAMDAGLFRPLPKQSSK